MSHSAKFEVRCRKVYRMTIRVKDHEYLHYDYPNTASTPRGVPFLRIYFISLSYFPIAILIN